MCTDENNDIKKRPPPNPVTASLNANFQLVSINTYVEN